ncbi:MAG: hypothetical protein JW928_06555 [Candidatus Aureabacteria bacterium]|nr:hypothetical protein [Candidatus Auribacterota bacterium]
MRPIDIQNAIDHVQAGERILHVRKVEDGETTDHFAKRLSEEVEQKRTSVTDTEHAEGLKVEEEGGGQSQYQNLRKKKKKEEESTEEEKRVKEEGKGNILDLNA